MGKGGSQGQKRKKQRRNDEGRGVGRGEVWEVDMMESEDANLLTFTTSFEIKLDFFA